MQIHPHKYYDWNNRKELDNNEGAPFSDWMADPKYPSSFAVHPEGFLVFLRPDEIHNLDEYSTGDPYNVADKINSLFQKQRISMTLEFVANAISKQSDFPKILDVACGEGHITAAIRKAFPMAEIFAFDGSLSAIRRASQSYGRITFAVANAYDPPYPPDYFDCVVCNNIWEHVPDPLNFLACVERSLKINGHLIISTPSRYHLNNMLRVLVGKPVALASTHHVTEYSVGQVLEQLQYASFRVERIAGKVSWSEKITFRSIIKLGIGAFLNYLIQLNRSHHSLASTVFYLARKCK